MVKYTVDAVMALLAHISPIPSRPTFSTLWDLADRLYEALRKIETPDYPNTGHAGYMMLNFSLPTHGMTCPMLVIASSYHPHSLPKLIRKWQ